MSKNIRTAFLLGAGLGTRLKPLTNDLPKPLLPLNGQPIITHVFERLALVGIERFIVNTHHRASEYPRHFPHGSWRGIPITFVPEEVLLDTAGGLKNIEPFIKDEEDILIHNADIVSSLPLNILLDKHLAGNALATLALRSQGHLLNVALSPTGFVTDIRGALNTGTKKLYQFTGVYIVQRALLEHIPAGKVESIVDTFIRIIRQQTQAVAGVVIDTGYWNDLGTLEQYQRICKEFANE